MNRMLIAFAALLCLMVVAFGQGSGGIPAKSGHASFKFDNEEITYDQVSGNFNQSYGFTSAMLTFSKDGKPASDHFAISIMMQNPGTADLNQRGNGIGYWRGGKIITYLKSKSQCTMKVTKLTATSVEGVAECPVANEQSGEGTHSLSAVKFSASAN